MDVKPKYKGRLPAQRDRVERKLDSSLRCQKETLIPFSSYTIEPIQTQIDCPCGYQS